MKQSTDNNTISGYHIKDGKVNTDKVYKWHIPKSLRWIDFQAMDIVKVIARGTLADVIVIDAFREDIEDTGVSHNAVIDIKNARGRDLKDLKRRDKYAKIRTVK